MKEKLEEQRNELTTNKTKKEKKEEEIRIIQYYSCGHIYSRHQSTKKSFCPVEFGKDHDFICPDCMENMKTGDLVVPVRLDKVILLRLDSRGIPYNQQ